jgi:hypothetical protein
MDFIAPVLKKYIIVIVFSFLRQPRIYIQLAGLARDSLGQDGRFAGAKQPILMLAVLFGSINHDREEM